MSVRATERLIGDVVTVTALPKSPPMVVNAIDVHTKIITTAWFIAGNEYQEGTFPAASLDRLEAKPKAKPPAKRQTRKRK